MKLSEFIAALQRLLERGGDIPLVNFDGEPFSYVHVEREDGRLLYGVTKRHADPR